MNLELLMEYGDREIAEKHALTTARNHFREDGTTFHLVDYADDGTVLGRQTVQGYADDSAWARGQAWALYGYAMMAREERGPGTKSSPEPSTRSPSSWRNGSSPASPEDGVPYWDFFADGLPGRIGWGDPGIGPADPRTIRTGTGRNCAETAERILRTLASPEYLAEPRTNGGFLLKHSVGNIPGHSEVDVPLTYADYYFLEALRNYRWIEKTE